MIVLNLIQNIALLVALAAAYQVVGGRLKRNALVFQIVSGLLFGGVGVVGMMTPVRFAPGIIFDGRSIILSVAGLFGGPIAALIAAVICGAYRLWLGGGGAVMGICVIAESSALGVAFYYWRRRTGRPLGVLALAAFGMIVHVIMLILMLTLPGRSIYDALVKIGPLVLTAYPLGTVLICQIFLDYEKQALDRKALRDSEAKYRHLVDNVSEMIYVAQDGMVKFITPSMTKISGYTFEDLSSRPFVEFVHPEDRDFALSQHKKRLAGMDVPSTRPYRVIFKSGDTRWVSLSATLIEWEGRPATLNFMTDITESKQAEDAIRESRRHYQALCEVSPVGIFRTDASGVTTYVNPQWSEISGLEAEKALGDGWLSVVHPDDRPVVQGGWTEAVKEGVVSRREYRFLRPDGAIAWVLGQAIPEFDSNDNLVGFVGTITDITERKQAEEEREKLQTQLAQAQKMQSVGRLAGGVAHDFNNMLQTILGYTEMALEEARSDSPLRDSLLEIRKASQRSADLTRQLLAFARKQTTRPRTLDLNDTVSDMLKMLRRLIGEDIDLAWMPGLDIWNIKIDPSQIDQILANLCVNARDAIAGVGKVVIETNNVTIDETQCADQPGFLPGQYVMLAVTDNGCGMEKDVLEHVFEPFYTTKEVGQGTGLGLATVYGIAKQNNGFVSVYSEPGKGTTFKIYFPRHLGDDAEPIDDSSSQPTKGGTETVLIVEDEKAILGLGKAILERLGYSVLTASLPSEAIRLVEQGACEIHLLITDVIMPEMTGRDLAERLTSLRPGLKVLFMSGYTANAIAHQGVLEPDVHFIQKPFRAESLAQKVRQTLQDK